MASHTLPATLRLPHPYLTTYQIDRVADTQGQEGAFLQIAYAPRTSGATPTRRDGRSPPQQLHSAVQFSNPQGDSASESSPPESINTFWGRVRRSPKSVFRWTEPATPTLAQAWLIVYAIFTIRPELEYFRLSLDGRGSGDLADELKSVSLAVQHPQTDSRWNAPLDAHADELVVLREAFWQGAGSPFGPRPVWVPGANFLRSSNQRLSDYPAPALSYTITTEFPKTRVHALHPRRPQKPQPGSVIYSRYIPHLDEHLSVIALDYENEEHLQLFHKWQNDPRVAAGWNETGTLEQHRQYLRNLHNDPHTFTVLAAFDDTYFSYHELYWAKEDHFGVHCEAGDFDRGRHSLTGDEKFRGARRTSAWWSSLIHYLFLDDPRTLAVVGEPKATGPAVLVFDLMSGLSVQKFVDLAHKRSAFMRSSRERFFQICPFEWSGERTLGGTGVKLEAKL